MARIRDLRGLGLGLLVGLLLAIGATIAMYSGFPHYANCDHRIVREFPSPNGKRVALVIGANCGTTTLSSVAVKNEGQKFDFAVERIFSVKGENNIEVIWGGDGAFTIVYDTPGLIYTQVIVWRAERISYRERSSTR